MKPDILPPGAFPSTFVQVRQDAGGSYTAQVLGLPEVHAEAATSEEAIAQVQVVLTQWLSSGRLVPLVFPSLHQPSRKPLGWAKNDPLEQEFLEDLARMRHEDLERTLREDEQKDQGCSGTSSTPTT